MHPLVLSHTASFSHPLPTPDVAASTETPTSEKLNAATARAQTSAAVGAVSLVAVLSYFM
jgi:hypothetical protein